MSCQYQSWVAEAAVEALEPARQAEFDLHVAGCAACREALERERALQSRIQGELTAMLSESPSAAVAAEVRKRISEESSAGASEWRWLPAVAGTFAVAALVVWLLLPVAEEAPPLVRSVSPEAVDAPEPDAPSSVAADSRGAIEVHGLAPTTVNSTGTLRPTPPAAEVVIAPPGQWQAVAMLYRATRAGVVAGETVVAQPTPLEERLRELSIADLQVAPLEDAAERPQADRRPPGRV
jgi:hypothetical protein